MYYVQSTEGTVRRKIEEHQLLYLKVPVGTYSKNSKLRDELRIISFVNLKISDVRLNKVVHM